MITTAEELAFSRRRLMELQARYTKTLADSHKDWRTKEMELAGVRGVMEEIESEMLVYIRAQLQQFVDAVQIAIHESDLSKLPGTPDQTLGGLDSVAEGLRLTSSARVGS
jgi:hypothetical protein